MHCFQQDYFENAAKKWPHAPAVDDGGETTTYAELDQAANQLAHLLKALGSGPNERVCIMTPKNINMYRSVLGALKSGACWVPLSTGYPKDRLQALLKVIEPVAILVDAQTISLAQELTQALGRRVPIVSWDVVAKKAEGSAYDAENIRAQATTRPNRDSHSANDLAYIIFTSGSTGIPKGVMVEHRNTACFLSQCEGFFQIEPGQRFAHFSELTFDPSVLDMFHCWATGGVLVPFNKQRYRVNPALFFREQKINVIFTVPSAIAKLRDTGYLTMAELQEVKHLLLTGEAVSSSLVRQWYDAVPQSQVYNMYGTTETAIVSHWYKIPRDISSSDPMPVGLPLPGIRIFLGSGDRLHDASKLKSDLFNYGESVVYGAQVSPGYWANEFQTNSAFRKHPEAPQLPQLLYFTGDLLRVDKDGLFYYMGRVDHQVKVRGHRVELGEIENILAQDTNVHEAVVVPVSVSGQEYDRLLVAFVKLVNPQPVEELERFLEGKLPKYMVPSRIVSVEEFPYSVNGKIDRLALGEQAKREMTT